MLAQLYIISIGLMINLQMISTLSLTTNKHLQSSTSDSASTATSGNRTATTAAVQSNVTKNNQGTQNTTMSLEDSSSPTTNSSDSASSPSTTLRNTASSTVGHSSMTNTVNANLTTTDVTRSDLDNSKNTTSGAPTTTVAQNTTVDSSSAAHTSNNFSTTTLDFDNGTTVAASTNTTSNTTNNASSTSTPNGSVSTMETANTSLTTEHTSLTPGLNTTTLLTVQPTANSSFAPYIHGALKDSQSDVGVVFGAIIGSILGVVLVCLIAYFICGGKKSDAFTHRRLYEDIRNEPVLRLDNPPAAYDLSYDDSSYHNPTVVDEPEYRPTGNTRDFIPMNNLPSHHPSA